jgi:signal peptidase II
LTKNWAESYLQYREPIRVVGDFLKLTYSTNPGAAFSFLTEATLLLSSLKLAVVGFILYFIRTVTNSLWAASLALLFGGVLGNLYDRAFRPPAIWRGEVVDWIQLPNWPIFNIADSAIVCAGIAMTLLAMRNIQPREPDVRA